LAVVGAVLDLGSKSLAFSLIGEPHDGMPGPSVAIWANKLSLTTSYNRGALWGFGHRVPGANHIFAALSVLAAVAFLVWLFWYGAAHSRSVTVALGFMMAGTVGNCYDRILLRQVRDFVFIEWINWPVFNVADSLLVCGAIILIWQAMFVDLPQSRQSAAQSGEPTPAVQPVAEANPHVG
jgi:signal peptidase II